MKLTVHRTKVRLNPDFKKVIPRFFNTGNERSFGIIQKVMQRSLADTTLILDQVLTEFGPRYRDIKAVFLKHFNFVSYLVPVDDLPTLQIEKKLLLGAYFTMEYSIEAAALFNPSIVADPDQSDTSADQLNVIISFRATGESHLSSIVFRKGVLDADGLLHIQPASQFISEGLLIEANRDSKMIFRELLSQMTLPEHIRPAILNQLHDPFSYKEMEVVLKSALGEIGSDVERKKIQNDILRIANTSYELAFPLTSEISERVIFPVTFKEKNGIEDARFVRFTDDDGMVSYIATYTAYDGSFISPQLIETNDFCHFKISPLHGKAAVNKNLALFPRKINGQYVMLSRIDNINNYIMFSSDLYLWEEAILLQQPQQPWELVQIGNGGSPIETDKGWLIITHGVGPMRKYCLGASLFDLENPMIELGRLKEPLLMPNEEERDGYVPNVVYTCGSIIHHGNLILPYALSDYASSFATIPLTELLNELLNN